MKTSKVNRSDAAVTLADKPGAAALLAVLDQAREQLATSKRAAA